MTRALAIGILLAGSASVAVDASAAEPPAADLARVHALVINGGGSPEQNYQSHHLHVKTLVDWLRKSGLPAERISIFSSDGSDPKPDLAVRARQPEANFWMLRGTPLEQPLRTSVDLVSSSLPGFTMAPATKAALSRWFAGAKARLRAGDTLFLYVTDHGTKGKTDPRNNEITLWNKESLTVDQLGAELQRLDPGVRVVSLMSQCFSGGFARLYEARRENRTGGGFCGYFSSTADRPAYGCYPENLDKNNVGHSFHFFAALANGPALPTAHAEVLTTDQTPDVPLQTSDVFLADTLAAAAKERKQPLTALVDNLLTEAWKDTKTFEPEIRLLDRIGQRFGMWSPRSLDELDRLGGTLPEFAKKVESHKEAWEFALGDLNNARLEQLGQHEPKWKPRLRTGSIETLARPARRALAAELLTALHKLPQNRERLDLVRDRAEKTAALAYRLEVRQGVVLRIRARLMNVAGRLYLARHGTSAQRQTLADLESCEALRFPKPSVAAEPLLGTQAPYPPFQDDVELAKTVLPAWMGIQFASVAPELQKKYDLPSGAALIQRVYPGSPAAAAGFLSGDILIGPPKAPFTDRNEVRVWTFLSQVGEPRPLVVQRGPDRFELTLVPRPFPGELPTLPGPPKPGVAAPPLSLERYRGMMPSNLKGQKHLLFFWGTYCGPCKRSLPELMAYAERNKVPIIAISDESRETLDEFFKSWKQPFPEIVAHDELRRASIAYGTSGVPTFVFVDENGVIRSHHTGYSPETGIGVPGWSYRSSR